MKENTYSKKMVYWSFIMTTIVGLYLTTRVNYLLFHSIVELFSIVIACTVFVVTWNSLRYIKNQYLTIVGISYLFIGVLDLLHTLSYKGMPIFVDYDYYANQLWIAARFMESITLLTAFTILQGGRSVKAGLLFAWYTIITGILIASIFYWKIFPICFVAGKGLTDFKIYSEYVICSILIAAIFLLIKNRKLFADSIYRLLLLSIIYTIISELAFTYYIDNYGISNIVGHYFKLFSFLMIYHAIISSGVKEPFNLIFKELKLTNDLLQTEVDLRKKTEIEREAVINNLKNAMDEIKVLEGILPMCMHCKKIRDDSGYWSQLETYIHKHSGVDISHGICPDCMDKHYSVYHNKDGKST